MRCLACDKRLNEREATRKYASTGTFIDLCNGCFATVAEDIPDVEEADGGIGEDIDDGEDGVVDEWDYQQFRSGDNDHE